MFTHEDDKRPLMPVVRHQKNSSPQKIHVLHLLSQPPPKAPVAETGSWRGYDKHAHEIAGMKQRAHPETFVGSLNISHVQFWNISS